MPHLRASSFSVAPRLRYPRPDVGPHRNRERLGHAERVAALERVIADQPRRDLFALRGGGDHRRGELVVAVGFVDEPPAVRQDGDETGLSPVDDVWVRADPSTAVGHQRHRAPRGRRCQRRVEHAARRLAERDPVAGRLRRRERPVLLSRRGSREQLATTCDVVGEAAGREQNAARARTVISPSGPSSTAPVTAPSSVSSRVAGVCHAADARRGHQPTWPAGRSGPCR